MLFSVHLTSEIYTQVFVTPLTAFQQIFDLFLYPIIYFFKHRMIVKILFQTVVFAINKPVFLITDTYFPFTIVFRADIHITLEAM